VAGQGSRHDLTAQAPGVEGVKEVSRLHPPRMTRTAVRNLIFPDF
jgi:hypothetical protein